MIALSMWLALALGFAGTAPPPPARVSPIRFEDLVRFSDVIAVGRVVRIEEIHWSGWKSSNSWGWPESLPPKVPLAELTVTSVLKGGPETKTLLFLAVSTWTCDITSAEVGETALFFLQEAGQDEVFDAELHRDIGRRFPGIPFMRVLWSGRGKMPLRSLPDGQYATYWAGDVILPDGFPDVEGPDPRHRFIRSAPLSAFQEKIAACLVEQREAWLTASVAEVLDDGLAWDLELTWDRHARLTVHEPAGARVESFLLDSRRAVGLSRTFECLDGDDGAETLGTGKSSHGTRMLQVFDPSEPKHFHILETDEDWMRGEAAMRTYFVLEAWRELRGSFEEPACSDHRPRDRRWLDPWQER